MLIPRYLQFALRGVFFIGITVSALLLLRINSVEAINANDWDAGNIISDQLFTKTDGVTAAQLQSRIVSGLPSCDVNGVQASSYSAPASADTDNNGVISRAEYGAYRGNPAPFTCLKDYYENPNTGENNYGSTTIPVGARSAAQLIIDAGVKYDISPKALLVMLRKESSIFQDDWPFLSQFQYAMGAYCPDGPNGANCDPEYAGFGIQIEESARLFRYYLDNMDQSWWSHKKVGVNNILWNTAYSYYTNGQNQSVQCGGSSVTIKSRATAALYTYTPYQPNQAALDVFPAPVSSGSSFDVNCAAYGNRNFWYFYNEMFGSTAPNLSAALEEESLSSVTNVDGSNILLSHSIYENSILVRRQDELDIGVWEDPVESSGCSLGGDIIRQPNGLSLQAVIGCDNSVWVRSQTQVNGDNWTSWKGAPACAHDLSLSKQQDGRVVISVVGCDNSIWLKTQNSVSSNTWTDWSSISGCARDISSTAITGGQLVQLVRGCDNGLFVRVQAASNSTDWLGWQNLGACVADLGQVYQDDGRLVASIINCDDDVELFSETAVSSGVWEQSEILPSCGRDLATRQQPDGRILLVLVGCDDGVWVSRQVDVDGAEWTKWESLSGCVHDALITMNKTGQINIMAVACDDLIWQRVQASSNGSVWNQWSRLPGYEESISTP